MYNLISSFSSQYGICKNIEDGPCCTQVIINNLHTYLLTSKIKENDNGIKGMGKSPQR